MLVFKLALLAGACACVVVAGTSWNAGYPPEIALTRGVVAFVAMSVLGFLGQLTASRADGAKTMAPRVPTPPPPPVDEPEPAV